MDYKQAEYSHKENLEKIRKKSKQDLETLKRAIPEKKGLGGLADLDLGKVSDILGQVEDITENAGEEGGLLGILKSPILKGIIQGLGGKKKDPEDEDEDETVGY